MKKVFIISGILFVIVLGLWAIYNFGFKNSATNPIADPVQKEIAKKKGEELVVNPNGKLEPVVSDALVGAALYEKSLFYYSTRNQDLRRTTLEGGNPVTLYSALPGTPTRLVWSPRRDAVLLLLEIPGQAPLWHHLSFSEKILTPLKKEMSRLTWTNIGESILYLYTDPESGSVTLNMASPNGTNWKKLLDMERGDYFLSPVPRSSLISFWKRPNGLETGRIETITLVGDARKSLFADRFGVDGLWSKDGSRLLIGSVTEKKYEPVLGLVNENGGEYRDLGVPTLISKVAWSQDNQTIYYALPSPFTKETVLPNDYFKKSVSSKDTFWKMNVDTGKRERLIPLEEINIAVDATDLFLSDNELSLFFTDRVSSKLYHISL